MSQVFYNKRILSRIEERVNLIIPIASLVALLSSVAILYSTIPVRFAYIDAVVALIFATVYFVRHVIHTETKLMIIISIGYGVGFLSFADGGFSSAGLTIFMMCNVLAVLMLSRKRGFLSSGISFVLFLMLGLMDYWGWIRNGYGITLAKWAVNVLMYFLFLIFLHTSVYAIKEYLLEIIGKLELNVQKSHYLAYFDRLTDLPNYECLKEHINEEHGQKLSSQYLVVLNLRNLRTVNSVYNESFGDAMLIETASVLRRLIGGDGYLARVSGNEFALWIRLSEEASVVEYTNHLLTQFGEKFELEGVRKKAEFYCAVARSGIGEDFSILYKKVQTALAYAKRNGINEVVVFNQKLEAAYVERERLHDRVKVAVDEDVFTLVYQKQVNSNTGQVVGVEALSRWEDVELGQVSPALFIDAIEILNLDVIFGQHVLRRSFADYRLLQEKYGSEVKLAVNISPKQLISEHFTDYVGGLIDQYAIEHGRISFEITEDVMIHEQTLVKSVFEQLKHMGIRISLDDFGTGYSSLNHLVSLDIDAVKIDKTFIWQHNTPRLRTMLEMIRRLTDAYGLELVAEGVETEEQLENIRSIGCYIIQGYYYGKPERLEEGKEFK